MDYRESEQIVFFMSPEQTQNERRNLGESPNEPSPSSRTERVHTLENGENRVLLRIVNVKLYGPDNRCIQTAALCDEASTVTLIDRSILRELDVKGIKQPLCIQWTNNVVSHQEDSECLDLEISGDYNYANRFKLKNVRTVENIALPTQKTRIEEWQNYPHLNGLPISSVKRTPMILIGQDNIHLTVPRRIAQGPENVPIATKTKLGWILHGRISDNCAKLTYNYHICNQDLTNDYLHQLVKNSFTIDSLGVTPVKKVEKSKEEARAVKILNDTAKRLGDRFEIGLLWKEDNIILPESRPAAFKRLLCVEKQMQRDPNFKSKYFQNISKYIEKGYARKLSEKEAAQTSPRTWYIPHFGVTNINKPNKLRLVFDAAATTNGTSLNKNLLPGPDLLAPLISVLMKFRERKIAFSADIREMFHQVKIRPSDQDSQRFLWREHPKAPCDVYQMEVMTFGATCSPTSAQFIKNLNAKEQAVSQRIIDAITKKHYVDDYLDCADTPQEAFKIISEVRKVQKSGGFELVGWSTNSEEVKKMMMLDIITFKDLDMDCDSKIQRILGMYWDPKTDNFIFKVRQDLIQEKMDCRPTKREILKTVMSLYDPLGLLSNFTIRGRIIVQDIWRTGIGWDDFIDEKIHQDWEYWIADLKSIDEFSVPRCYSSFIPIAKEIELHVFCDSSKMAFSAVAYLRIVSDERVDVNLVFGKSRVSPTKPISIPRLELQAAVLGSRLANTVKNELDIKIDRIIYWTDSTTVLYWIKTSKTNLLGQFESHRVGEIQENTEANQWRWVPSKLNVADMATRTYNGSGGSRLSFETWFTGPKFLQEKEDNWPKKELDEINTEHRDIVAVTQISTEYSLSEIPTPNPKRFSDWIKLLLSTAWVIRISKYWLSKIRNSLADNKPTIEDIKEGERLIIIKCQQENFPQEISALRKNMNVKEQSRLNKLSPKLDENGVLVLQGRTDLAPNMNIATKRPAIMPKDDHVTKLYLQYLHEKNGHQGIETVLNNARQKFWIIDGRTAVKSVFSKCQMCRLRKATPEVPQMGQLPPVRLTPNLKPFTHTGMDYFGPLLVTVGRRQEKRWGVIFTCLAVRAIHLEIAHSLSADSVIMAIRRMVARKGEIQVILSDNGTNFKGASIELRKAISEIDETSMARRSTS